MLYYINPSQNLPFFNINAVGCDSGQAHWGPGQRDKYQLHFVYCSRGYYNGRPVNMGQGFISTPKKTEHYYHDEDYPWSYIWLSSYDKSVYDTFKLFEPDEFGIFDFNPLCIPVLEEFAQFIKSNHLKTVNTSMLLEYFLKVLNTHLNIQTSPLVNSSHADMYFDYCVNYITTNIYKPLSVTELTEALGISQPYLYNIFRKKVGKSPKAYINDYKLSEAKRLLTETNLSITEISHSLGFNNPLVFSKFFSSKEKISPRNFRAKK